MDEEQKKRNELFEKYREDVLRRQLSNTENYDKAVLSLGTTFLGFSVAFLKEFVSYKTAIFALLLPLSWMLFCLSIVATIISFFTSQKGLATQLEYAEKYYIQNDSSYLTKKNQAAKLTDIVNYVSGISFVFAVFTTIFFAIVNLDSEAQMSEKKISSLILDGASISRMQQAPGDSGLVTLGAQIPVMQLAPSPVTTQPVNNSAPQSAAGSTKKGSD
ncbi:MAG: hypothetical protein KGZ88_00410 [Methylomicrobium sp.]|nr:hypothetical protein [Methylomicrobium sp.]